MIKAFDTSRIPTRYPFFILQLNLLSNRYDDILPQVPRIQHALTKMYHNIANEGLPTTLIDNRRFIKK
jgi:hypothetical protein